MKKFTKTLSIVLLIAMCVSMFTVSAFATDDFSCCTGSAMNKVNAKPATCEAEGNYPHLQCAGCSKLYADDDYRLLSDTDVVIPKLGHKLTLVPGQAATCLATGIDAHYKCDACGKTFADKDGKTEYTSYTLPVGAHNPVDVAAVAPGCETTGLYSHRECSVCGMLFEASADTVLSEADVVREPAGHSYAEGFCSVCGVEDPANPQFHVSGTSPVAYTSSNNFEYSINAPKLYYVERITVGGNSLYEDAYSISTTGKITIYGAKISSIMDGKQSAEVVFYGAKYGTGENVSAGSVGGFYINNATAVNTLTVDGFEQKGFIKGSTEAVAFQTNDSNPNNVKLYSFTTKKFVDITAFDMEQVGSMYTYTFEKSFLDTLDYGTYYVRCYYGADSYVSAGTIIISKSEVTKNSTELKFTNSTVSDKEYKYISGGTRPEIYCQMLRDSDAKLQISNDGYSWKNVNVHDYYIEQSNGDDTSYAWLKTAMLDSQKAASNVYFRVIIPASALGTSTDAVSNWIKVTTGNTLAAVDTNKHVINSSKNLKFVCSDVIEKVYVGGQDLSVTDPDAFRLSNDGKYVTLYADFLNDRTAGSTYTLTVLTKSGEKLSTTFQILTTAQASASPRTGDDSNIALWSAFLLLSGAAVVAVLPRLKKHF